jgi:hypothetical protein
MYLTDDRDSNGSHRQPERVDAALSNSYSEDLAACLLGRRSLPEPCLISHEGLLAGEKYLRKHSKEYDNGTPLGSHRRFIAILLSEALRASFITFKMPPDFR